MQHYEGGHNQFGPWALKGYQQEFSKLAQSMKNGTALPPGPEPRDIAHLQKTLHIGVVWDGKLLWEKKIFLVVKLFKRVGLENLWDYDQILSWKPIGVYIMHQTLLIPSNHMY